MASETAHTKLFTVSTGEGHKEGFSAGRGVSRLLDWNIINKERFDC